MEDRSTLSPAQNTGVPSSYLQSVSCASTQNCNAAGSSESGMFVENWNGSKWSIVNSLATAPFGDPVDISCTTTASCLVVSDTSVESWNGSHWTKQPGPAGKDHPAFTGIACVSAALCTAVGSSFNGTDIQTLVESWNGHDWSKIPSPNPTGSMTTLFQGVTCSPAHSCTAVGSSDAKSTQKTLVEVGRAS